MRGIIKATGKEIELYRIWRGKWQTPDKDSLYDIDEIEMINNDDQFYLSDPTTESGFYITRNEYGYVMMYADKPDMCNLDQEEGIMLGYGPEAYPNLKEGELKRVKLFVEIVDDINFKK